MRHIAMHIPWNWCRRTLCPLFCLTLSGTAALLGQNPAPTAPEVDVLLFTDGERLTGHFVKSTGSSLTFKSDAIGEITVDWSKVKALQSSAKVAVIPKNVRLHNKREAANVPQGTLSVQDQQVHLTPPPPQALPVADTGNIVDQATFQNAVEHQPNFFQAWKGTVTVGASLVHATQESKSFTGAVNIVRAVPTVSWLEPRNRTSINILESYGDLSQPGTPTIVTSIFHGDIEHDEYFSPRLYGFAQAAYDHNYSQGLNLAQIYSGGIGWTVIRGANQTLDLKGSMSYIRQQFGNAPNQDLIGSVFAENYNRKFKDGFILDERLVLTPAWNNTSAYSALFNATLTMPVYKRINGSLGFTDSFLNDPPPGFKKNSLTTTIGLTYTLP